MPRKNLTLLEKLNDLEAKKESLLAQRHQELLSTIKHCGGLTIDDSLLSGFLLFALNKQNKDHPILQEFRSIAKANKIPSKPKQQGQSSAAQSDQKA